MIAKNVAACPSPGTDYKSAALLQSDISCDIEGHLLCRGAVKLYADFFQSDVIVASPIALATKQAEAGERAPEDLDFLSSIEIVVAARCDVFLMQNWAHVVAGESHQHPSPHTDYRPFFNCQRLLYCSLSVWQSCG